MVGRIFRLLTVLVVVVSADAGWAQQTLSPELKGKIDAIVKHELETGGTPSASLGVVMGGKVVYTAAFGHARLAAAGGSNKPLAATPEMHYAIGSISKQFTTACILLLVENGKLTLDDPVSRWFPELTRANEVRLRNLLTHTSGYEDYAPQDYTIPAWMKPTKPIDLIHEWAEKPLDFDPGTKWQYSNTNFVLAALIVEKVTGIPFWQFLDTNVLRPLKLENVIDLDSQREQMEPEGFMRNALGPLRPAVLEAQGWYFGDATMAMPVKTLLDWDISMMDRTLLKPASYDALETEMKLKDGTGSGYGLGVQVKTIDGHRSVYHSGEVGGFVSANSIYPDDKVAVAVLTNQEASYAAIRIQKAIAALLLPAPVDPAAQAKTILSGLQQGKIDRGLFTPNCNFYFSQETIGDFKSSLAPLGEVKSVTLDKVGLRGGMTSRSFDVTFANGKAVSLSTFTTTDGKLEQFLIE